MILLNEKCLEATLPDAAGRSVLGVLPSHVGGESPLHPTAKVFGLSWPHHQVKVIWHDAGRKDGDVNPFLRAMHQREELLVVRGFVKNTRFPVPTVKDVITVVRDDEAGGAWHAGKIFLQSKAGYRQMRRVGRDTQVCPRLLGNEECPH